MPTSERLFELTERVLSGIPLERVDALFILNVDDDRMDVLLECADRLRDTFKGKEIDLCSVTNARSGSCSENCSFCAQSAFYDTEAKTYPLVATELLVQAAQHAKDNGATKFCIATSGKGIRRQSDLDEICNAVRTIKDDVGISMCATLGDLSEGQMITLKEAGLRRFHHNLETSENYFPNVCTTHTYQDRIEKIKVAQAVGLSTCVGGIFGLGESTQDRIDLAFAIRELDVDSVPINFLVPIAGTPLEGGSPPSPMACLRIIALFRFLMPDKEIRVCGGRVQGLKDLHDRLFAGGASGMMIGNYLTTMGPAPEDDRIMMDRLGFTARRP
jgi:biotin synthase